ncbi:hypothetical protein M9978_00570 [Sphingomonas sp. MG17]|jgi:hypothetical protein|uniref:Uncharacterized protein n=1 Tax=Sphingomonas tagetis TaxID=2949092 RepID=A0A9X2HFK9_9SPHN|nr:hypothetical protein [Sphingomonas tagetis]MCP3728912.1 hypothetical protein [Sphingomonas tagetis]
MIDKLKGRFTPRRIALIVALAVIVAWAGWRTGAFEGQPQKKPCEAGRKEIKDNMGKVIQVIRTTCGTAKD